MSTFMDENFLLPNETAGILYHEYAKLQPIYDYHNHLSPRDIACHRRFFDLTELWLETDHYKWRAMRANGVKEHYITGKAPAKEKFLAFAEVLPKLAGSPLYHWCHLELQRYFAITTLLNRESAETIWELTKRKMAEESFDTVSLLERMKVKVLCTTDDPKDDLQYHAQIREDASIPFKVLPSFRPDRYLTGDAKADEELCAVYQAEDIFTAFARALDHFCANGCRVTDHSFGIFTYGRDPIVSERMDFLAKEYKKRGLILQLHLGPVRNTVPSLWQSFGPDAGADSIGFTTDAQALSSFLSKMEGENTLPKTILYCLDPSDNAKFATMAVNFAPQVQFGAAWWFNDHIRGIRRQLDELMEQGSLAASVGMLTDSRSFTSFVRHEYFRRILCARLGELVENGEYPEERETLGKIVEDICYHNAAAFFGE